MDTKRQCGECQLCCKLLPVRSINKGADEKCKHQRVGKGCMVYHKQGFPLECGIWNCRWLMNDAGDTRRPDRTHYVIDIMPDYVTAKEGDGKPFNEPVIQIWCDSNFPDAHHDPALRRWIDQNKVCALIRYNSYDAFLLVPPSRSQNKKWFEKKSPVSKETHSAENIIEMFALK